MLMMLLLPQKMIPDDISLLRKGQEISMLLILEEDDLQVMVLGQQIQIGHNSQVMYLQQAPPKAPQVQL